MTAQTQPKPQDTTQEHYYMYPTVRPMTMATAHPAPEAWVAPRPSRVKTGSTRPRPARRSYVIVPSRSVEKASESPAVTQAYEERLLCSLLELRDPAVHMTYVTSMPIAPAIVDYYLSLLPRRVRGNARSRLRLVALCDPSPRPLCEKLLERPGVIDRIRRSCSALVPYTTAGREADLADRLGVPMHGADPRHTHFGTKSGCRKLFAQTGVPHPAGIEGVTSVASVVEAIARLRAAAPGLARVVVKLDEGVAGDGNASVQLAGLPLPGAPDEAALIARRVAELRPEDAGVGSRQYLAKLARRGGIVEEWITGHEVHSPSVQLQVTPRGELQLLSTHDQILGGPTGQAYRGCRFPAEASYAPAISDQARRVGQRLADAGVLGRFAIDFVVTRGHDGCWQAFAIELNLRKGGTTHPYEMLAHLTGGSYDAQRAAFVTPTGQTKHYVATDHLEGPSLPALGLHGALALARRPDLRFDPLRRTGAVLHMLSSVRDAGRLGCTAIADSAEQADALFARVQDVLLGEAAGRPEELLAA